MGSRRVRMRAALATLLGAAVLIAAPVASSDAAPTDPDDLAAACRRVPGLQRRVDVAIIALRAPASRPGSIAWLEAQLTTARQAGRAQRAVALENRLAARRAKLQRLVASGVTLDRLAQRCDELL